MNQALPEPDSARPLLAVEKGVPLPDPRSRSQPINKKFPFSEMQVGDSFLIATFKEKKSAISSAWHFNHTLRGRGKVFASRKVAEGWRIWRVA